MKKMLLSCFLLSSFGLMSSSERSFSGAFAVVKTHEEYEFQAHEALRSWAALEFVRKRVEAFKMENVLAQIAARRA